MKDDILQQAKKLKKDIQLKKQLAMSYRELAEGLQSPRYSDMPKSPNRKLEPMAEALNTALEIDDEVFDLENQLKKLNQLIFTVIQSIDDKVYQMILLDRYLGDKTLQEIGRKIGYSRTSLFHKHNQAVVAFCLAFEKLEHE